MLAFISPLADRAGFTQGEGNAQSWHHCSVFWGSTLPYLPWITNVKNVKKSQQ